MFYMSINIFHQPKWFHQEVIPTARFVCEIGQENRRSHLLRRNGVCAVPTLILDFILISPQLRTPVSPKKKPLNRFDSLFPHWPIYTWEGPIPSSCIDFRFSPSLRWNPFTSHPTSWPTCNGISLHSEVSQLDIVDDSGYSCWNIA
jgi:hypothetical protein